MRDFYILAAGDVPCACLERKAVVIRFDWSAYSLQHATITS